MTPPDRLLNVNRVAEILGVSRVTVYRRLADGTIPAGLKLGPRAVRWRESDIKRLIEGLPSNDGAGEV